NLCPSFFMVMASGMFRGRASVTCVSVSVAQGKLSGAYDVAKHTRMTPHVRLHSRQLGKHFLKF
ncbi:hypothetical protein, partial [Klebsiella pneumoniae]|uniref:hypothetical protein n=1 Tax=Klebsiella pneumoniae TaxID=573 RepID=UPI0024DE7848